MGGTVLPDLEHQELATKEVDLIDDLPRLLALCIRMLSLLLLPLTAYLNIYTYIYCSIYF